MTAQTHREIMDAHYDWADCVRKNGIAYRLGVAVNRLRNEAENGNAACARILEQIQEMENITYGYIQREFIATQERAEAAEIARTRLEKWEPELPNPIQHHPV